MRKLLDKIKIALADYQSNKERKIRQAHNREQVKLILQGLEERGY